MSLQQYFPSSFIPRNQQLDLIDKIESAFKSKKFVICCAPTGTGKSFLSATLSNSSKQCSSTFKNLIESYDAFKSDGCGDYLYKDECMNEPSFGAFTLTITKNLQDQYTDIFSNSVCVKGKSNYICAVDPNYSVDVAPCIYLSELKDKCLNGNTCPYYSTRNNALINQFSILNYSMFLSLPNHVKHREYIVCDEASELEDELVKRFSRELHFKVLKKLGIDPIKIPIHNYSKFRIWLESFLQTLCDTLNSLQTRLKRKKNETILSDRQKYMLLKNLHISFETTVNTWNDCEYIVERDNEKITLKPLRVDNLAKHIFNFGDKILLMSATIIDHKKFAHTLGIQDYEYIEVDSMFDPKKAPIFTSNKYKLNHKNLKEKLPHIVKQIKEICAHHHDVKGVIHSHTHEITDYLKAHLITDRFIFREQGNLTNEQLIKQHVDSNDNTVIVSPSMTFGVDLRDDLARFQIIIKAAYLPLGDERVKRLSREDPRWYQNKMLNNFIQACGRGVRSENDYCVTYVLDACITDAVVKSRNLLPKYFIDRCF